MEGKNLYNITSQSYLKNFDYSLFLNLYEPILGPEATVTYFYFVNNVGENGQIDDILMNLGLTLITFANCKKRLEALGLLDSFIDKNNKFTFAVYAAKSISEFFDDVILCELLKRNIGETRFNKLIEKFKIDTSNLKKLDNISSNFDEVYDDFKLNKELKFDPVNGDLVFDNSKKIVVNNFNNDEFFTVLYENGRIYKESISENELKTINSLASIYQLNEKIMADFVIEVFDGQAPKGKKVDETKLKNVCFNRSKTNDFKTKNPAKPQQKSGKSNLAKRINLMQTTEPVEYLKLLQNNVYPIKSDINIIYSLKKDLNLNNEVINALIDYVLKTYDNVLTKSLVEKIGASLVRSNITTAEDAMNYLLKNKTNDAQNDKKSENNVVVDEKIESIDDIFGDEE